MYQENKENIKHQRKRSRKLSQVGIENDKRFKKSTAIGDNDYNNISNNPYEEQDQAVPI